MKLMSNKSLTHLIRIILSILVPVRLPWDIAHVTLTDVRIVFARMTGNRVYVAVTRLPVTHIIVVKFIAVHLVHSASVRFDVTRFHNIKLSNVKMDTSILHPWNYNLML